MKNIKRKDAYFGLHFDFHANNLVKGIGTKTTADEVGKFLDATMPDYIQLDTKGHPGYSSYKTKVGVMAPGLECDHLKIICKEAKKRGITLIAHHSSLIDKVAGKEHPEWEVLRKDGSKKDGRINSLSEYVDVRLIPQLIELNKEYGFDGVWLDGDVWEIYESYSEDVFKRFYEKTGIEKVDDDFYSESRQAYRQFCIDEFYEYMKKVFAKVKKECPDFEMTCNYAFSHYQAVKPMDEIDFLSADVFDMAIRTTARTFAVQNKPWDIMRWGAISCYVSKEMSFYPNGNKAASRLCRDGAMVTSLGGGYQVVNAMTNQGRIRMIDLERMKKVSEFVRKRQEFNYMSKPIYDTKMLVSEYNRSMTKFENNEDRLFFGTKKQCEYFNLVTDAGYFAGAMTDYNLIEEDFEGLNTIILPEITHMTDEMKTKVKEFVHNGGNVIVCGKECCNMFLDVMDAKAKEFDDIILYVSTGNDGCSVENSLVFEKNGAIDLCDAFKDNLEFGAEKESAIISNSYGKGKFVFVGFDMISLYEKTRHFALCDIMGNILSYLNPLPNAYLKDGIKNVEIIPAKKGEKLLVNVINTTELYYDEMGKGYGDFPPLTDLTVAVKCDKKPKSIYIEPEHKEAKYEYDGKFAYVKIDRLDIHCVIVIDF